MMKITISIALLLGSVAASALDVPVNSMDRWITLSFSSIEANEVSVRNDALLVKVDGSASPLVYQLDAPTAVTGVTVVASWTGELQVPEGLAQGEEGADDFVLKFGVVEAGEQTLNWLQRRVAADWIKQLFRLAPEGLGVERINFLSTTQDADLLGSTRIHPLSDLLYEQRVTYLEKSGEFELTQQFDDSVDVLGLWISADGDDTDSRFDLQIEQITLHTD